jgi:hypothetical protein
VASVLGAFSWSKLLLLGRPSDGVVELTGGAPVMGGGVVVVDIVQGGEEQSVRVRQKEEALSPMHTLYSHARR